MRGNDAGGGAEPQEQPFIDEWPTFEEACSKFPVLANVETARLRLAQKFNRTLPKAAEVELAWHAHNRGTRLLRG
jgi:hypothetical protein